MSSYNIYHFYYVIATMQHIKSDEVYNNYKTADSHYHWRQPLAPNKSIPTIWITGADDIVTIYYPS